MLAIVTDACSVDDIGVGRSNGDVKHAGCLGKKGVALHGGTRTAMADQVLDIAANVNSTVDSGNDSIVGSHFHRNGVAFDGNSPGLTFIVGILKAFGCSGNDGIASNGNIVDIVPLVSARRLDQFEHVVGQGVETRANEAVVVTLLVKAVMSCSSAIITSANIDNTVSILSHAADHQVKATNLMPSDTIVVGLVNTATFGADVDHIGFVVINDSRCLTAHVVGTHSEPIKRVISSISRNRGLHGLEHISGVNQTSQLVCTKASHEALCIHCRLSARNIVSTLVSDGHRLT